MKVSVEAKPKERVVCVNGLTFDEPMLLNSTTWPLIRAKIANEFNLPNTDEGVGPQLRASMRKAFKAVWVDPYSDDIHNSCADPDTGAISLVKLKGFWDRISDIEFTKEFDVSQIQPWIVEFGKSPTELKKLFGKSAWRQISALSPDQSESLLFMAKRVSDAEFDPSDIGRFLKFIDDWEFLQASMEHLQSTGVDFDIKVFEFLNTLPCEEEMDLSQRIRHIGEEYRYYDEAVEAMRYLNDEVDLTKMKPAQYRNKTESLMRRQNRGMRLKKYPPSFEGWDFLQNHYDCDEGRATVIKRPIDLLEEGDRMKHCVGGYVNRVLKGDIVVLHIETKNGDHATCAFHAKEHIVGGVHSIYAAQNRTASNGAHEVMNSALAKIEARQELEKMMQAATTQARDITNTDSLGHRMSRFLAQEGIVEAKLESSEPDFEAEAASQSGEVVNNQAAAFRQLLN